MSIMLTLKLACDVLPNRQVTIQLPPSVQPGHHEIVIVLDKTSDQAATSDTNISCLMQFSGAVRAFLAVDGMDYQNKVRAEWN
jgi:hypothetical protein